MVEMKLTIFVVATALFGVCCAIDNTKQPGTYGPEVVEAVVNIIRETCLFADDKRFLRRLAYVESHDGTDPKTFRSGYYGGIWQVDHQAFLETQNQPSLTLQYNIIRDRMGINWNSVSWSQLTRPLYSGIAAALFTLKKSAPNGTSWNKEEQGKFWAANFHSSSSASNFSTLAGILDQGCKLQKKIDIVFVVDSSSSLNTDDFDRAKAFMQQFVEGFNIGPTQAQVGLVVYSSSAHIQFFLNSYSQKTDVKNAINGASYTPGGTQTGPAIDTAVQNVFSAANGARGDAARVMIVITDGDSDDTIDTRHAAERAHADSIVTFSVGVGAHIQTSELQTIASNPGCTHVYKVKDYSEIKFMTEEIQKATCIAPLYINSTFSCQIGHCPPLAIITGPTGVTIKTSVSCGGINVYSSITNPYPSSAQFEWMQTALVNQATSYYYNEIDKILYLNLKDNQGIRGPDGLYHGSEIHGCTATITPCFGECNAITVRCFRGAVEIPCDNSYFNCTENWNFTNPCTDANIKADLTRFPHPYNNNRFLMCDLTKKLYVVLCPPGEVFEARCSQCIGEGTTVTNSKCEGPAPSNITNPCTRANILADKMFWPYPYDVTQYIHCDVWGKPWVESCPSGEEWDQFVIGCIRIPDPSQNTNPCTHHVPGTPYLYPHSCDPHKYIHCDTNHQAFIQSCQFSYLFLPSSRTCVPVNFPGSENLVNTCHGGTTIYYNQGNQATTPLYQSGTTNSYGYVLSAGAYAEPCTAANIAANQLFFPYAYNIHQYIQCDNWGNSFLQTCSGSGRDYYDPYSHTCVDGPVFVDGILTRPPPMG